MILPRMLLQALEGAELAPGPNWTRRDPLSPAGQFAAPSLNSMKDFGKNLRSSRRGAVEGPSVMTTSVCVLVGGCKREEVAFCVGDVVVSRTIAQQAIVTSIDGIRSDFL